MFLTSPERVHSYEAKGWWSGGTVDDLTQRNRSEVPDRPALVDPLNRIALDGHPPRRLNWSQLGLEVDRMAAAFLALGLAKDDILCIQAPNVSETLIAFLACARIGLIASPVVMQYRSHELEHILEVLQPKALLTVGHFAGFDHAQQALALAAGRPGLDVLVQGGEAPDGAVDLDAAVRAADPQRAGLYRNAHPTTGGEVLTVCWTSGTEAQPKGVPRDHNQWLVNARVIPEAADLRDGEVLLNPFPLVNIASIGGLVMPWLAARGVLVLHHPFDVAVFLQQIAVERVNYTIAAPAILTALLKSPHLTAGGALASVRAIGSGSAPLPPWMIRQFKEVHGIEVCNIFGSNEGASLFSGPQHVPDPEERARYFPRFGVEGVDWPGEAPKLVRSRLADPATEQEITDPNRPGELRIEGASTFSGYFRNPELTAAAFDEGGWFKTGDLFEIAGAGPLARYYRFVGRCKDIIVRGGVNISPAEIDALLAGHPALQDAAVVGVPDEGLGERMCVAVVPSGDVAPSLSEITAWLKGRGVAVFKLPEQLVRVDELPRNAMNKVLRHRLREMVLERLA